MLFRSNSEYWKSDTMFDLKYCNWNKDMLMGVLPNSQFGDVAAINLGEGGSIPVGLGSGSKFYALANSNKIPTASASSGVKPLEFNCT